MVFSPAYKEIIARTPHIKYRTSLILKIALVIFVADRSRLEGHPGNR